MRSLGSYISVGCLGECAPVLGMAMGATNPGPWEAGHTGRRWSLGFRVGIRTFANRPEAGAPQGSFWNLVHLG